MIPGRGLDAAVARVMGDPHQLIRSTATLLADGTTVTIAEEHQPLPYSTDDAVALAQCVPWLRGRGYSVVVYFWQNGRSVRAEAQPTYLAEGRSTMSAIAPTLAHALCQVVLAVAGGA